LVQSALERSPPLAELKQRSYINEKANAAGNAADFLDAYQEGLPGF
jgi:hypothetical protein